MKISSKMAKALNEQISWESYASNFYLAAAAWCENIGYDGSAKFFYTQSDEERQHMLKFIHYLNSVNCSPQISAVKAPPKNLKSLESICKTALQNEQTVSKLIHKIVDMAQKENDHKTHTFLQWFVTEQVEEEDQFENILQKFTLLGRDKLALHEIDKILAQIPQQAPEENQ